MLSRFCFAFLFAALLFLCLPACSDDDPAAPEEFAVVIEIVDADGAPLAGLPMSALPDTPFYMDGKAGGDEGIPTAPTDLATPYPCPYNRVVAIRFMLEETGHALLEIEDIEGTAIRRLVEQEFDAGPRVYQWDGCDDEGADMTSGVYTAHLVVRDMTGGEIVAEQRRDMLMANMDPTRRPVGTSDAQGRIVLSDRRLFPWLFDPDPIPAVDESGESIGSIELTATMRFYVHDPVAVWNWRFDRDVTGPAEYTFVLDD